MRLSSILSIALAIVMMALAVQVANKSPEAAMLAVLVLIVHVGLDDIADKISKR